MKGLDIFLILLSIVTITAVILALKTSLFIQDKADRAHKAICFLIAVIGGYIFASPLGGIMIGIAKESFETALAVHRNLFNQERGLEATKSLIFWFIGGFLGAYGLEEFRYYVTILYSAA